VLLSVVIPVYNEASTISTLLSGLAAVLRRLPWDHEILFVNDGSTDDTLSKLEAAAAVDASLKILSFSRNFGHQAAITAGLDFASGDAIVVMDADLQDPPEVIERMFQRFQVGYDIVSAQRISREGDGWLKRVTAAGFYWVMRRMVDDRLTPQVGDFRLFSRAAMTALRSLREQHRFVRGMVAWLGLREAIIPFHRGGRVAGATKYSIFKMLRFAWTAVSSFSGLPLRMAVVMGLLMSLMSLGYFCFAFYSAVITKNVVPGWASIVFLQCLFSGATLVAIGLVGDYVSRIYEEIKRRPLYVVAHHTNISLPEQGLPERCLILGADESSPDRRLAQTSAAGSHHNGS
jgi:dolichol-phosphate mannosyltransferase